MSMSQQLPKDSVSATTLLLELEEKDKDTTICRYPTCYEPRQGKTGGTGKPPAFCLNPEHTAVANHRFRQQLKEIAEGVPLLTERPRIWGGSPGSPVPAIGAIDSLRGSIINRITQLQNDLDRYLLALKEIADPDRSAALIQAAVDQATTQIAEAQQNISVERTLRMNAEDARRTALTEAEIEHEAASQAIKRMEAAEARNSRQQEEYALRIAEMQAEHEQHLNHLRAQTDEQIQEIEEQTKQALALAQANAATAQEEVRQAHALAHDAQANARTQVATAELLLSETRASLERERKEKDQLRAEFTSTIADARSRAEADRAEAQVNLKHAREEIDRLRRDLDATRLRADQLATLTDELRTQLVQVQITDK
jgi:colicin import membrane protein